MRTITYFLLVSLLITNGAATIIAAEKTSMSEQATSSIGASSISLIRSEIKELDARSGRWTKINWGLGAAAALCGVCAIFSGWLLNETSKKLDAKQTELIAAMNVQAQELHRQNLELEQSLSPRYFRDQLGAQTKLEKFAGTKFVVECLGDDECRRTAGQIAQALVNAKWLLVSAKSFKDDGSFRDGVVVYSNLPDIPPNTDPHIIMARMKQSGVTRSICDAVIEQLNRGGMETDGGSSASKHAEDTVVIRVGMKPNPYTKRRLNETDPNGPTFIIEGNRIFIPPP